LPVFYIYSSSFDKRLNKIMIIYLEAEFVTFVDSKFFDLLWIFTEKEATTKMTFGLVRKERTKFLQR